ncbi:unnamed protein product [Malus baccata var. baccata]
MSGVSTAAYVARRAAQKEKVRILYRRALRDTLNWAVHRHLFYPDADALRERFETNKHVEDPDTVDRLIANAEATYNKWRHPDPYIGTIPFIKCPFYLHKFIAFALNWKAWEQLI